MRILLISGHGAGDIGAQGNGYREIDLTRELANIIAPKLRKYATVDVYDQNRNAFRDCENGVFNIGHYDYVLEIHFNAFNISAYGTECFVVPNEDGITVEQEIMKRMSKWFTLRDNDNIHDGVKRTRFLVINTVKNKGMSGALLETCFIDNPNDIATYQANKNFIADDIVEGIAVGFGLIGNSQPTPSPAPEQPKPITPNTPTTKHKLGQKVRFSTCYVSSTAPNSEAISASKMAKDNGTITKIIMGAKNPYLLDDGMCFVNDGDIREVLNAPTPPAQPTHPYGGSIEPNLPSDFVYENGKFTCTEKEGIHILKAPSLKGERTGSFYNYGEHVFYEGYVNREGYIWITWISASNGERRWMAVREMPSRHAYGTFE